MIQIEGKFCKDCKIMIDDVEDAAMSLIYNMVNSMAFEDSKIRIMPDVHAGVGVNIGTTFNIGKMINPAHVGVDIGCAVSFYITNTPINPDEFRSLTANNISNDATIKQLTEKIAELESRIEALESK